jgi:adenine deaminase
VLEDLSEPRPQTVIARGQVAADRGRVLVNVPEPPWSKVFVSPHARMTRRWQARAEDFDLPPRATYPVIRLVSAVITRLEERAPAPGDLRAALVDRGGRWVAPALVAGFADRLDGLATTTTTDFNILTLGRSQRAMAQAVNRLTRIRGGIVIVEGDAVVYELPLPLGGIMTAGSLSDAAGWEVDLRARLAERGYAHHDPLFTMLFLAADFLPAVRLSPRGVWDVKRGRVLLPRRARRA